MSEQIPLATLKLALAAGYGLDELQLQTHDQAAADAYAQIYGQVAQLNAAQQDFSGLAPALHKASVEVLTAAFTSSGLAVHDFTAEIITQANATIQDLQTQLANLQASAQASVDAAYAKGVGDGQAQASSTQVHTTAPVVSGGFAINIDTTELARQIAGFLGTSGGPVNNVNQQAAGSGQVATAAPAGTGMVLGGGTGLTLGKPKAEPGENAQPVTALGAQHPAYNVDPSLVGDGSGAGGGMTLDELQQSTGAPTVAAVRADTGMHKVGLPTAKKQFGVGATVYIVPSSDAAQWDGKPCVVANPADGGDLETIAKGATAVLTKSLHYYVPN